MKNSIWKILVISVLLVVMLCYVLWFQNGIKDPVWLGMPFVLWTSLGATLVLLVIWIIGVTCLNKMGGWNPFFADIAEKREDLMTLPGPNGLFNIQFLIASAIAITLIPVTQPQFTIRIIAMKNLKAVHTMALAVGFFAVLVIFPTLLIGFYGALHYAGSSTADFVSSALIFDQIPPVGALAIVGLFAACLSTTNAQIFALGTELRSLLTGSEEVNLHYTKISLFVFSILVFLFSLMMHDELALLARVSFTGTSMMAPLVLGAILVNKPPRWLGWPSFFSIIIFLVSLLGWIPGDFLGWRLDILLYVFLLITSIIGLIPQILKERHENK